MDNMLPIGSVVELEDFKNKVTIIGLLPSFMEDNEIAMYEYVGCDYLKGYSSSKDYVFFDESKIKNVYFIGYALEFDFNFLKVLHEIYKVMNTGVTIDQAIDEVSKKISPDNPKKFEELKNKIYDYYFNDEVKKENGE